MTPIRCMSSFAQELFDVLMNEKEKHKASMIICSSKLLLSQLKAFLDKSMMENGQFSLQLEKTKLLQIVKETVDILQGQASLRQISIVFKPNCSETTLMLDPIRL